MIRKSKKRVNRYDRQDFVIDSLMTKYLWRHRCGNTINLEYCGHGLYVMPSQHRGLKYYDHQVYIYILA